jgi:hypothetical protein
MDDRHIQKNILDLKFRLELQKIHASLVTLTVGVLAFLGTFVWYEERIFFGLALSAIVVLISLIVYVNSRNRAYAILSRLDDLTVVKRKFK